MQKDYEQMGIYDLRNYARAMGVHSPTTLRRDELISKINEIINGKEPEPKKTNKGRPPRHKANEEYVLDFILPNNLFDNSSEFRYKTILNEKDRSSLKNILSESSDIATDNILFKGFYIQQTADFGLACLKGYITKYAKENTVILSELSNKYYLKNGDYIVGIAKFVAEKNVWLATEINYINDVASKDISNRLVFDDIMPSYPNKILKLNGDDDFELINSICPVAKGARIALNLQNSYKKVDYVKHFLNTLSSNNNLRTMLVSIDDSPEDVGSVMYDCKDVEICSLSSIQTREEFFEKVFNYINNCVNRLEFKQDLAIVFYNASKFIEAYAQNLIVSQNLTENTAKIMATNKVKDIFNLCRMLDFGSLTIAMIDLPASLLDSANCVINFNALPYKNTNVYLSIKTSATKNSDKILSKQQFEQSQNFVREFDENIAQEQIKKYLNK